MEQSQQVPVNELKDSTDMIYQSTGESKNSSQSTSPSDIRENSDESQQNRIGIMKTIKKVPYIKKRYDKITDEQREKLIDAVENKNEKIKHVAKRLGINYSSAKSICQVFKSEGRTNRKTCKKRGLKNDSQQESEQDYVISPEIASTRYQTIDPPGKTLNANFRKELDQIMPEKDSLEILRDRLLQSRVSKSTTNTTNSPQFMSLRQENENKQVEVKPSLTNQSSIQALPQASSYVVITEDQLRNLQALNNQGQNLSYAQIVPGNGLNTNLSYNSQNTNLYNPQIIQNGFIIQNVALNQPQHNFLKLAENTQNYQSVSSANLPLNQQLLSSLYTNSNYQLSSQLDVNRFQTISQSFPQLLNQQQKVLPLLYENKSNSVFTHPLLNNMLESNGEKFIYLNNQAIDQTKFYLA